MLLLSNEKSKKKLNMSPSLIEFLEHIQKELEFLLRNSQRFDYETFVNDDFVSRAFLRSLEIIGEAAKRFLMKYVLNTRKWDGGGWQG